jgi:hypothetical protein
VLTDVKREVVDESERRCEHIRHGVGQAGGQGRDQASVAQRGEVLLEDGELLEEDERLGRGRDGVGVSTCGSG